MDEEEKSDIETQLTAIERATNSYGDINDIATQIIGLCEVVGVLIDRIIALEEAKP